MVITTYTYTKERNRIDKQPYLGTGTVLGNEVKMEAYQNILAPEFLYYSTTCPTFNYVHIDVFNRYYFVEQKEWQSNNCWLIRLAVDVLYSHKTSIMSMTGVASRLEDKQGWGMIIDDKVPVEATQNDGDIVFVKATTTSENGKHFDVQGAGGNFNDHLIIYGFTGNEDESSENQLDILYIGVDMSGGYGHLPLDPPFQENRHSYTATTTGHNELMIQVQGQNIYKINGTIKFDNSPWITYSNVSLAGDEVAETDKFPITGMVGAFEINVTVTFNDGQTESYVVDLTTT